MAFLKFDPTAAGTGIVSACICALQFKITLLPCRYGHDFLGQLASPDQVCHDLHWFVRMLEESLVTFAEVVQPRFSIGRLDKTVLGTFTVAHKKHFAFPAVLRKRILLVPSEFPLLVRGYEIDQWCFQDVS